MIHVNAISAQTRSSTCRKSPNAFGFGHMTAENTNDMEKAMKWLLGDSDRPLILEIRTSPEDSAEALNRYFKRK